MKALSVASVAGLLLSFLMLHGAHGATERVVYSFCSQQNCPDGALPAAGLINVEGTLYGTASLGAGHLWGNVFSVDPATGVETTVYSFCSQKNCADGGWPNTGLINVAGTLYGTTTVGGANCPNEGICGTAFSLNPTIGVETVLHSFGSTGDGASPNRVTNVNGTLYGTTVTGGTGVCYGQFTCGTIFSLDPATGAETVLYSFCSQVSCPNGAYPHSTLIDIRDKLYGLTESGGAFNGGTAFTFDRKTGVEKVLHSFGSGTDGAGPFIGPMTDINGTLSGMTSGGGRSNRGTVFSLDRTTGHETVLYSFCSQKGCADGAGPYAGLIDINGVLYGTTAAGGANCQHRGGCGTVFSFDPATGAETVLHSFGGTGDGYDPQTGLINVKGTLYGTTFGGGAYGDGAVFAIRP